MIPAEKAHPSAKRLTRQKCRATRASRDPGLLATLGEDLSGRVLSVPEVAAAVGTGGPIRAYASYGTEPPTGALLQALARRGATVALPRMIEGFGLDWVLPDPQWLARWSARETLPGAGPPDPVGIATPDLGRMDGPGGGASVIIMPALAVDLSGARLGQGRGYYDRLLEGVPPIADGGPLRLVLVFDDEVLQPGEVPTEPHDALIDIIVTPTRVLRIRRSSREELPDTEAR